MDNIGNQATYGDRLRQIRTERGLSQHDLSLRLAVNIDYIGLSQATIGKIERGERVLAFSDAIALARVFQCSLDHLAGYPLSANHEELSQTIRDADAFRLVASVVDKLREDETVAL